MSRLFPTGRGEWLMPSAHMDTVGADVGIMPQIRDGIIFSEDTSPSVTLP